MSQRSRFGSTPPISSENMFGSQPWLAQAAVFVLVPFYVSTSRHKDQYITQCYNDPVKLPEWLYPPPSVCPADRGRDEHGEAAAHHPVEFVFLIEYSQRANETYITYFSTALRKLASSFEGKDNSSTDARFAVVLYSLKQELPTAFYVRDLHSMTSDYSLKETIAHLMWPVVDHPLHYTNRELSYMAVDKAVQMLGIVMNDSLTDTNGHHHSLHLNPLASVHIVLGLGLYQRSSDNKDSDEIEATIIAMRRNIEKSIEAILGQAQTGPNTAVHFFFARDIHPAVEFIGSSLHEERYRDCTHLNKALTLKSLLAAQGAARSLQAHLVALGRDIHIMELAALTRADCILAISPILWSSFDLSLNHTNKCSGNYECVSVYGGGYCSPLHGCMAESLNTSAARKAFPDDRVPLRSHPVMSHADLHRSKPVEPGEAVMIGNDYPSKELSITTTADPRAPPFSLSDVVVGKPHTLRVKPESDFAEKVIKKGKPVILKDSVVKTWRAMDTWDFSYLRKNMGTDSLYHVKCTDHFLTFDPDRTAPLKLNISLPFSKTNMSTSSFFACIQRPSHCSDGLRGHYYFGSIPETLQVDLSSTEQLFHTERDYRANRQFMWISSAGMITHGHFDQDFNFFVQLIGKKRFTLWPASQHELLYVYPRVHPLWHKSRVNFRSPDLTQFPNFAKSRALQVIVEPGDVLYVPPYTWHYVETLSPSVSLSTMSHDYELYHHMNAIYRHDHKFDLIQDQRGQMFALRLYLDMMIHDLYGFNQTTSFFVRLLANRFMGLEHLFPPRQNDSQICSASIENKIPTCVHVHGYAKLDMSVVGSHFHALQPETRDILFANYVEEITAQVVGVGKMLAFFRFCFLEQEYYVTELGDEEHSLWDHKDVSEDDSDSLF